MSICITENLKHFNYLVSEIDTLYHEAAQKLGLSDSVMSILYALWNNGGSCPISDICRLSGIRKQTINSALRKLEQDHLICLTAHTRRRKLVSLTESGKCLARETVTRLIAIENEIFGSWSEEEQSEYLRLTREYMDAFRQKLGRLSDA